MPVDKDGLEAVPIKGLISSTGLKVCACMLPADNNRENKKPGNFMLIDLLDWRKCNQSTLFSYHVIFCIKIFITAAWQADKDSVW